MSSNQESASRWLSKKLAEAKYTYTAASVLTLLSAACFVLFAWHLSGFAAQWLDDGLIQPHLLVYASAYLTGRYLLAHIASLLNYNAGNTIVASIKQQLYPRLLQNNHADSIASTHMVTRACDDQSPFIPFLFRMPWHL